MATLKPTIKNLYPETWKTQYSDLRLSTKQTESVGMACSYKYLATPWDVGGGGVLGLIKISDCSRDPPVMKLKGHTGSIQDLAFSPFYESILASGSEDTTIRIWEVPSEAPNGHEIKDAVAVLTGSSKKVIATEWNPVADFILASGCFDGTVALWNVEKSEGTTTTKISDAVLSIKWNRLGDLIAATSKDKILSVIDPRNAKVSLSVLCHEGPKATKCCWLDGFAGAENILLTTGFSKSNERELHIWDLRNMQTTIGRVEVDRGSQPLYPVFDETLGLLYITGKGDGNSRYYQMDGVNELRRIDDYRSNVPIKSFCFMPKLVVDQMRAEVGRMFKNENGKVVQPISFIVPRKNQEIFQADLYPPTPDAKPALSAADWLKGGKAEARRVSLKPGDSVTFAQRTQSKESTKPPTTESKNPPVVQTAMKSDNEVIQLQKKLQEQESQIREMQALQKTLKEKDLKIKDLENEINTLKISKGNDSSGKDKALTEANQKLTVAEKRIGELEKANQELSDHFAKVEGTLKRAASNSALDDSVRQEFNEMRDFFREILDETLMDLDK